MASWQCYYRLAAATFLRGKTATHREARRFRAEFSGRACPSKRPPAVLRLLAPNPNFTSLIRNPRGTMLPKRSLSGRLLWWGGVAARATSPMAAATPAQSCIHVFARKQLDQHDANGAPEFG